MAKIAFRSGDTQINREYILEALEQGNCLAIKIREYITDIHGRTLDIRAVNNYLLSMYENGDVTRQVDPTYRTGRGRLMYFLKKESLMIVERPTVSKIEPCGLCGKERFSYT